jgi:hypothetical protein
MAPMNKGQQIRGGRMASLAVTWPFAEDLDEGVDVPAFIGLTVPLYHPRGGV